MPHEEAILGLNGYEIKDIRRVGNRITVWVKYTGGVCCPHCEGIRLRKKDRFTRVLRHESWGMRATQLLLDSFKYCCLDCGKYFNQRFPGIQPRRRCTEPFRRQIFWMHFDGICRKRVAEREKLGTATVERWFHDFLGREASKRSAEACPQVLGIDEHFFTRKKGFATTFCDLKHHKVYDVVLGRSEASLDGYFRKLKGKEKVKVVCIDLASNYRRLIRKHFPNARIVADRFHVIRLVNHHFLSAWKQIDPVGAKHRGLLSLMRRHPDKLSEEQRGRLGGYLQEHPELAPIYTFIQQLMELLRMKTCTAKTCRKLIPRLLEFIKELKACGLEPLETLGRTLQNWSGEIAAMWRFSKNNGITEGFHNKMEMISRRAFGFRNFENYRLRVRIMCA